MGVDDASLIRSLLAPDKCLTIQGGSTKQGTPIELRPCAGGPDQQFTFLATGEIRTQSGLCLDASSGRGNLGDALIVWPCLGQPNQRWSVTSAGEIRGINNLCLDVWYGAPNDGQPIVIWKCHGGSNQKWAVESVAAPRPPASDSLPPAQRARLALAFDPASSLAASSRVGPAGVAVGTPTYVAGPPARYALDPAEAVDFGAGALDGVWTSPQGWTYIAAIETGAKANAPHYVLVKENSRNHQFALFRNKAGGLELVVYTPAPNYENIQSVALPDFATAVVAMRYDPEKPHGQRATLFINGAPAGVASHTASGTGGAIAATSARLRMGIVEWAGYASSPALGAAYAYSGVLTDAEVATNSAWIASTRLWTVTAPVAVASVTISPATVALNVGGTQQLTATVRDAAGNVLAGRSVAWGSSDAAVASVSAAGLVTARAAGAATITAASEGKTGAAAVAVAPAPAPPPPPPGSCALVTDRGARATSPLARPGYLAPVTEPDFGTTLVRVGGDPGAPIPGLGGPVWGRLAKHRYPKDPVWSADGRMAVLKVMDGAAGRGVQLYIDGETYRPIVARSHPGPEARWHPTLPDVMIYVTSQGGVGHWNPRTGAAAAKFAPAGYGSAFMGPYEGNPSADGRYVAVNATRSADGRPVVYVVDVELGRKSADVDLLAQGFGSMADLDWASVSQGGRYLVLHGRIGGVSRLTKVYDRATLAPVGFWQDHPLGHFDLGIDAWGNEVAFGAAAGGPYAKRFVMRRLADGAVTPLTEAVSYDWHASTRNVRRPGWGYAVTNGASGSVFDRTVYAVKLDGSGAVERYAHHRTNHTDYDASPFAVPSPDGRRVMFASNWGDATGRPVQAYVIDTRPLCP